MAEVGQAVVDRRCREHEQSLGACHVVEQVEQAVVTGGILSAVTAAPTAGIAEVMGLVDDHDIGLFRDTPKPFREIPFPAQIGVAEDSQAAEIRPAADIRQPFAQMRLPDSLLGRFRGDQAQ